jgi:hypothetical protein
VSTLKSCISENLWQGRERCSFSKKRAFLFALPQKSLKEAKAMPNVTIPVVEVFPVLKRWFIQLVMWDDDIQSRMVRQKGKRYPFLCLEDELDIKECLFSKIGGKQGLLLLKAVLEKGSIPIINCNDRVHGLVDIGLLRTTGSQVVAEPFLKKRSVKQLLDLDKS